VELEPLVEKADPRSRDHHEDDRVPQATSAALSSDSDSQSTMPSSSVQKRATRGLQRTAMEQEEAGAGGTERFSIRECGKNRRNRI
jgi:hypothetical protein